MSAIFAVVGGEPMSAADLQRAVLEMATRGAEHIDCRGGETAGVAAGRFEWEMESAASGPLVVDDGVRVVVLDGTLYYRDALRRAIAGATTGRTFDIAGDSAGHLIIGAYRAWGTDCARHLEGDFAFALWDRDAQLLVCARDIFGTRPLFYGRNRDRVLVASMATTVARRSEHGGALDLGAIGDSLSGAFNLGEDTAFWALTEIVRARLGVGEDDDRSQIEDKLATTLAAFFDDEADRVFVAARLAPLLGLPSTGAELPRAELFAGWRRFFEGLAGLTATG